MSAPLAATEQRWRPRPLLAMLLRLGSVLVPAAAGAASALAFVSAIPYPGGPAVVPWGVGLVLTSTVATAIAERLGRRFLPLAVLLRLSLVFPDRAPRRFAMVRGAGNVRRLEERIRRAREEGVDPEPARAAEQILGLVAALSAHDRRTRGHSERVRAFTDLVAEELRLAEPDRDRLRWAALLHDVGKLRVPARILNKAGRPDPHEWETLRRHPGAGARIAAPLLPWLGAWGRAIEQHHERFGGGGYPSGAAGEQISLAARIVAVADSFEVMTAPRSYKRPMSVPEARNELAAAAGEQFDPGIVRAFLNISIGRLWWTVGPASWTALLPVIGPVQRAGGQLAAAARAGAAAVAVGTGSLLSVVAGAPAFGSAPAQTGSQHGAPVSAGIVEAPGVDGQGASGDADDDRSRGGPGGPGGDDGGAPGPDGGGPGSTDGVTGAVGGLVDGTTDAVDGVVDGVAGAVDGAADGAGEVVDGVTDAVDGVTDAVDGAADGAGEVVDGVTDAVEDTTGSLPGGSPVSDTTDDVVDLVDAVTDGVAGGVGGPLD
jgi:HD-GYP domain-containing protein (c-di-GMP phosphodiesterase class II)